MYRIATILLAAAAQRHASVVAKTPVPPAPIVALSLTSNGTLVEPLDLSLEIRGDLVQPPATTAPRKRLSWKPDGDAQVGTAAGTGWDATLRLAPVDGLVSLDAEIHYSAATIVSKEAIRIRLSGAAHAVSRELTWKSVDEIDRVDRGTPIFVATTSLAISGGPGFVAARYLPGRWRGGTFVDAELILDDAPAHPFSTYEQCLEKLPTADENDPNAPVNWTELEKRTPRDKLTREAGAVVKGHLSLLVPASASTPLIVERWPAGTKAAFVITDHADRTDPVALRAVLYGTSDVNSPEYRKHGLFGHGLALTKTFFAGKNQGSLVASADAKALADEIVAAGSEVGSHSITSIADTRDAVKKNLSAFDPWHVVTWIDHEPYTNCEALSNLGWKTEAPYGIRDLLVAHGYKWVWPATDLLGSKESRVVNLFGGAPSLAEPVVYPFPPDPRLWVFRSVWFYAPPTALARAIDDKALAVLEASRGLFVAHTYLSPSLATTKIDAHKADLVVKKNAKTGALELDSKLDEAFERLEAHVKGGTLASLTWQAAGDRLLALGDVEVLYREDGSASVENHGTLDVKGLTLAVATDADLVVEEGAIAGSRHEEGRTTIWLDLLAGKRVVVRATHAGSPMPLLAIRRVTLSPR